MALLAGQIEALNSGHFQQVDRKDAVFVCVCVCELGIKFRGGEKG